MDTKKRSELVNTLLNGMIPVLRITGHLSGERQIVVIDCRQENGNMPVQSLVMPLAEVLKIADGKEAQKMRKLARRLEPGFPELGVLVYFMAEKKAESDTRLVLPQLDVCRPLLTMHTAKELEVMPS